MYSGLDARNFVHWAIDPLHWRELRACMDIRMDIPPLDPTPWFEDRASFLRRMVRDSRELRWLQINGETQASGDVVFARPYFDETGRTQEFLREYYGVERVTPASARPAMRRLGLSMRWYWVGILGALISMLDFSEARYTYYAEALLQIQVYSRAAPGIERVFFFHPYSRTEYLVATHVSRHTSAEVVIVPLGCRLWDTLRLMHIPASLGLISDVQLEESRYLIETEGFHPVNIRRVGHLKVYDPSEEESSAGIPEVKYDIGFVSSGCWARRESDSQAWEPAEIEAVRSGSFHDTEHARDEARLLEFLIGYAKQRGLTTRVYPHPYERRLITHHHIAPTWFRYLDSDSVTWEDDGATTSHHTINAVRVAVSVGSTLIHTRLEEGREESYVQGFDGPSRDALGRYSRNVFLDFDDLESKLDEHFGSRDE